MKDLGPTTHVEITFQFHMHNVKVGKNLSPDTSTLSG